MKRATLYAGMITLTTGWAEAVSVCVKAANLFDHLDAMKMACTLRFIFVLVRMSIIHFCNG
jgi:hypothetical protein